MKRFKRYMATVILCLFTTVTILGSIGSTVSAAEKKTSTPLEAVDGQLVIKLMDTKDKKYEDIIKKYSGKIIKYFGNYVLASFDKGNVTNVKDELKTDKNVEYSEENALGRKSTTIDPLAKTEDFLFYSRAIEAWDLVTDQMKQTTVKVAVVDSGVKSDHPDLKGSVDPGMNYIGGSIDTSDDNGHGTQVAGVIAAKHNGIGINGIAGGIDTRIIPVKVLDSNGVGTTANIAQGIMYAANSGAQIINVSINGKGYSKLIDDAVQYAIGKGSIVVSSSGDDRGYSENYWPCNANGVIVAAENQYDSNTGKNIDVFASGRGNTTDIGSAGYKVVYGSSISAAVTTGSIALLKAKNPSYTLDQIRSILRKSNGTSGESPYLNLKFALESQSDFVTITSPVISQNTTGDVSGKITALNPSQLKQLSLFINDGVNAYKVIQGNGSKTYDINLPFTELTDGVNKLKAVATDSAGKTYVDERYFKSYGSDNTMNITVKDTSGNIAKNMLVVLYEGSNIYNPKEVSTDSNGQAIFYNVNKSSQYTMVVKNGDADSSSNKVLFIKRGLTAGKNIIDLSKEGKEITFNAYKADNTTMLSSANLSLDNLPDAEVSLNKSASTKIIVNKTGSSKLNVLSENEGYYYVKAIDSYENLSSVSFMTDSNISKVSISNLYEQQVSNESMLVNIVTDTNYNSSSLLGNFNVKNNNAIYLPKGNYTYRYQLSGGSPDVSYDYMTENLSLTGDTTLTYGEPKINLEKGDDNSSFRMSFKDGNHSSIINSLSDFNGTIILKDPNGKALVNGVDFTYTDERGYDVNYFFIKLVKPISGNYQASINLNYMGKSITSNILSLSFVGTQTSTSNVVKYTLPAEMQSAITSEGDDTLNVQYYIYNALTGEPIYDEWQSDDVSGIGNGDIRIPLTYCNSSYRIVICASTEYDRAVVYDRSLGIASNGVISINPDTTTKKISFAGNNLDQFIKNSRYRLTKIMPNNKNYYLQLKASNKTNLSVWADDGKYSSLFSTPQSLIRSEFNVSASNNIDNFDTSSLSNLKFIVPQDSHAKSIYISPKITDSSDAQRFEVDYNNNFQITPGIFLNGFNINISNTNDLNSKSYYFTGSYECKALAQNTIDTTKCVVEYSNIPTNLNKYSQLSFNAKISAGQFVLTNMNYIWNGKSNNDFYNYGSSSSGINIYNSENKFLSWNPVGSNNFDSNLMFFSSVSNLYGGNFKIKLDLEGLGLVDNGFNLSVTGDDLKIKVMDPFDTSKPLMNGNVYLRGYGNLVGGYKTGRDGYVYIPKSNIQTNKLIVAAESDKGIALFESQVDTTISETTIATPITALKNINIKPLDSIGGISLSNSDIEFSGNGYNSFKVAKLDINGQKTVYTNFDVSKIYVKNSTSFLKYSYSGQGDVVIDNKNTAKLNVSLVPNAYSSLNINDNNQSTFIVQNSGIYNVSVGSYKYSYFAGSMNYSGDFTTTSGSTKDLKFGTTLNLAADYYSVDGTTPSNTVKPNQNINMTVNFKDEFGNSVSPMQQVSLTYIVKTNGTEIKRGAVSGSGIISVNPNIVADSFDLAFEASYNNQKYTSNSLNYKMNLADYQKVTVKDPLGNLINEGTFGSSNYQLSGVMINNGIAYIDKNILLNKPSNVSLRGVSSTGYSVIYMGLTLDSNTIEIKDSTADKFSITANLPANSNNINLSLYPNNKGGSQGYSGYYENYNMDQFNKMYKNNYVWITKGSYVINVNSTIYGATTNENYALVDTISGTKAVSLDYTKTTRILLNSSNSFDIGGYNFNIENVSINMQISSNSINRISSNVVTGYSVNLNDSKLGSIGYNKLLSTPIAGDSYTINIGNKYKVKADNTASSNIAPNDNAKAVISVSDEYDNNFYTNSMNGVKASIELSADGQLVNTVQQTIYLGSNPYEMNFTPNVGTNFSAVFKLSIFGTVYSSNTLSYTLDTSNYNVINVKDPSGKPLAKGEAIQYGTRYKISQGIMYIPKTTTLSGTISITGTTDIGEYVINPQVTVSGSATNISLQGKKVNVATNFANISDINNGQLNLTWDNSYYGGSINVSYNSDKSMVSNVNIWLQDDQQCYLDNYFYDKSNNQYAIGKKFKNTESTINISADTLTEIRLAGTDNKNASLMVSSTKNNGGRSFSVGYNKLYVSSDNYYINSVSMYDGSSNLFYSLNMNKCINGPVYTAFVGTNFIGDYSIQDNVMTAGDSFYINGNIRDEYGNDVSFYSGNSKEIQFINAWGNIAYSVQSNGTSNCIIPSTIMEGKYSINIVTSIGNRKINSNIIPNIYITKGTISNLGSYGMTSQYSLYDGTNLVYSGNQASSVKIPNNILVDGKYYDLDVLTQSSNGVDHNKYKYQFSNGSLQYVSLSESVSTTLDTSVKKVILTTSKGNSITYDAEKNLNPYGIMLYLAYGETYNVSAYCEDSTGRYWASKQVKIDDTFAGLTFDRTQSQKLNLSNKFANNVELLGLVAKNTASGQSYDIGRELTTSNSVYLAKGIYDISFKLNVNGTTTVNNYKKTVDLSTSESTILVGANINYDVVLDKSVYSPNDNVSAKISNVKDGDILLSGLEGLPLDSSSISMNLVHGTKVLKGFNITIPSTLKGDCNFVVKGSTAGLGNIISKTISITVNNPNTIKEGDINLDGIVDIFDIVYVARDFGKLKGQSDYDPRVNLDSSDTVIDAKDLARAAVNYGN
ncbi:hypothetical protein CSC2_44830 [Clostridium zeae]|uniref:Peptidase S8/S53 domain-containing protein n=1 Tax=Clostridium zeae TaxID=2759022 RepID=A0ABQ1EGU4_9CLOT|nr:S8 family serine peptidase [Clostridium zeae]GFZ33957.1 hypothetical protein CSC2_44830 [Clostridium zeae]